MGKGFFKVLLMLLISNSVFAENMDSTRFVWNGELNLNSLNDFKEKIRKTPDLHELEFRQSAGAKASAGIIVNELISLIENKGLRTFARGQCASACAFVFLMGKEPTLLPPVDETPTYLMLHAMRNIKTQEINYGETDRLLKKIEKATKGKFSLGLLEKIYDAKSPQGGIFITREPVKTMHGNASVFFCSGTEVALRQPCQSFDKAKPQDFGIFVSN